MYEKCVFGRPVAQTQHILPQQKTVKRARTLRLSQQLGLLPSNPHPQVQQIPPKKARIQARRPKNYLQIKLQGLLPSNPHPKVQQNLPEQPQSQARRPKRHLQIQPQPGLRPLSNRHRQVQQNRPKKAQIQNLRAKSHLQSRQLGLPHLSRHPPSSKSPQNIRMGWCFGVSGRL